MTEQPMAAPISRSIDVTGEAPVSTKKMIFFSFFETFFTAPLQAIEWGITWGGSLAIGSAIILELVSYYFPSLVG